LITLAAVPAKENVLIDNDDNEVNESDSHKKVNSNKGFGDKSQAEEQPQKKGKSDQDVESSTSKATISEKSLEKAIEEKKTNG